MRQQGFSLIELLMGLTIVGIVLHLVSPAFATLTESNLREQAAQSLYSDIRTARTEAIARHQSVLVHALNGDWGQGWRIILDISGKGHKDPDNPLLYERPSATRLPIVGNRPVSQYVRFSSLGEPQFARGEFQAGTLHICAAREMVSQYQVVLAPSGRVSLRSATDEQALCAEGKQLKARSERAAL
jgi:type IV fimbrial biogenesis protein FimT